MVKNVSLSVIQIDGYDHLIIINSGGDSFVCDEESHVMSTDPTEASRSPSLKGVLYVEYSTSK